MTNEKKELEQNIFRFQQSWEEIRISDDFLFGKLMRSHPSLCQKLLQRVLPELSISHIEMVETQKSIKEDRDARGVRLDVYTKDQENRVYNIEMQMLDTKEIPRRSRYYQAMIDLQLLDKGINYRYLNDSYIIFICPFDLFQQGRYQYTFDGRCKEDHDIRIGDGAVRIFLNAKGTQNDVSSSLRVFLDYVAGKLCEDPFVLELEEAVSEARRNREWRHEYMTLMLRDQENIEKGREIGLEEGKEIGKEIGRVQGKEEEREEGIRLMISALKEFEIPWPEICAKVMEKYQLSEEEQKQYLSMEG